FQAEDGIRDRNVTGVQTCALPISEAFPFLRNVLPGIGCCLYGAACTYDNSPDEDFIIDTLPGHDNTLLITGLSGHGFKFASVLGEIAADFAQDKKSDFDLTPFRLSRFQ